MNPNAAAFALILKQRQALNGTKSDSKSGGAPVTPFAPAGATSGAFGNNTNAAHNPHSTFQPPAPLGARPPQPGMFSGGHNFMSTMSYAYPGAFPMNSIYPQYGMPGMYGAAASYASIPGYPMAVPSGNHYPNAVSHTQLLPGQIANMGRPPKSNQNKSTKPISPAQPSSEGDGGPWYCEPCDKEFTQLGPFEAHKATHETCWHPGCAFNATRKVVQAHFHGSHGQFSGSGYKMIDVEGQKFRVLMGQSPEEISQWRAERRKKFPTAEIEEAKKKELAALAEAGGVMPKNVANKTNRTDTKKRELESGGEGGRTKRARDNTENGEEGEGDDHSANGDTPNGGAEVTVPGVRKCFQYGRGKCKNGESCAYSHDYEPRVCQFFIKGYCKQGFKCNHIHDNDARKEYRANNPPTPRTKNEDGTTPSKDSKKPTVPKKPPTINKNGELSIPEPLSGGARGTLWRKLLEDEITKEENIVLQCLRYLVQSNYLEGMEEV